jgi:hypothetical protein
MTRSNRPLTQFAVQKLEEFLNNGAEAFQPEARHNTAATYTQEQGYNVLTFWLFDARIMEITMEGDHVLEVTVIDGGTYDRQGNPTKTTRERLNGLLDALGEYCLIPEHVRVFIHEGRCYVGKGAPHERQCRLLGKGSDSVCIDSNSTTLEFLA